MTIQEKTIQINGLNVRYLEDGAENHRALLLIHGGIGDARLHWAAAMPMLAEDFHVLAPDLPGFGKSDLLPQMRTEALLGWIKAFLESQKVEQAVVVGNSFGGLIVRLFAAANPQMVPAVILVNGGGVPDVPGVLRVSERLPGLSHALFYLFGRMATAPNTLKRMIYIQEVLTDDFAARAKEARSGFSRMMRMMVSRPMPKAHTPLVPTLILWGKEDKIAALVDAEAIKASLPGATLTEIADCGHMPQLETPDVFIWQVNTFLDKLSRPTASKLPGAGRLPNLPG